MYYVYFIVSKKDPKRNYVGITTDLKNRLQYHNRGKVISTKGCTPWRLNFYLSFLAKDRAVSFEKYLKTSSGKAFLSKRLLTKEM